MIVLNPSYVLFPSCDSKFSCPQPYTGGRKTKSKRSAGQDAVTARFPDRTFGFYLSLNFLTADVNSIISQSIRHRHLLHIRPVFFHCGA